MKKCQVPIYFELVNKVVVEVPDGMPIEKIHELALEKFNKSGDEMVLDKDNFILGSAEYDLEADIVELPATA